MPTAIPTQTPIEQLYVGCRRYGIKHEADAMWMEEFTWGSGRFDLVTLDLGTWLIRGYEMKRDRADFLGDQKWQHYLPYCNLFYFATLPGVIQPGELPAEVGHLELVDKTLVVKKRAKTLQPKFVRHTYGEMFLTRFMLSYIRSLSWRHARYNLPCQHCGTMQNLVDPRYRRAGIGANEWDQRLNSDLIG